MRNSFLRFTTSIAKISSAKFFKTGQSQNFRSQNLPKFCQSQKFLSQKLIPHFFFFYNKNFGQPRTFKIERITIFILSFRVGLVTQLNGPALGVLKHHYIIKRIRELLIDNSRLLIYNLLNQLLYYTA